MTTHLDALVLYNVLQLQLAHHSRYHMRIELTPETRDALMLSFAELRDKIAAPRIHRIFNQPDAPPPFPNVLNVVVVGSRGSGKTTFIKRHVDGTFERAYIGTTTPEPHIIEDYQGRCIFNVRDIGGNRAKLVPETLEHAHVAFILYDITSRPSYDEVPDWIDTVRSIAPGCLIVVCANKVDVLRYNRRQVRVDEKAVWSRTYLHRGTTYVHMPTSVKHNTNYYAPFRVALEHFANLGVLSNVRVSDEEPQTVSG